MMSARSCSRRCISRSTATRCCRSVSTNLHHAWRKGTVTGQSRQAAGWGSGGVPRLTPTCAHPTRTDCHICSLTCTTCACSYLNSLRKVLLQLNNSRELPHLNHSRMKRPLRRFRCSSSPTAANMDKLGVQGRWSEAADVVRGVRMPWLRGGTPTYCPTRTTCTCSSTYTGRECSRGAPTLASTLVGLRTLTTSCLPSSPCLQHCASPAAASCSSA